MKYWISAGTALLCLTSSPSPATAAGQVTRYVLIAGANFGGSDRVPLKYAFSDAQSVARVLVELGGVEPHDAVVLEQPSLADLQDALRKLRTQVADRHPGAPDTGRSEVLFYYSGHADERGLLLGPDRYSYRSLRDAMNAIPADVRMVVLDACASGAITRLKGGRHRKPFVVDASAEMKGHVFLTSSSADEGAQESDRIGASFFTHYLVSGLRGAADVSGEGKVTLNEAYQFAFNETLGRTAKTSAGAQHPAYDINLSGTGDVVITDLRHTSATLVLGEELTGRCFIRDVDERLMVELYKTSGRSVELGLEAGEYRVRCERDKGSIVTTPRLSEGQRVVLRQQNFSSAPGEQTVLRGGPSVAPGPPSWRVAGRSALGLRLGLRTHGGVSTISSTNGLVDTSVSVENVTAGLAYTRWLDDKLAATFSVTATAVQVDEKITIDPFATESSTTAVTALLLGLRRDFPVSSGRLRPYVGLAAGPVIGTGTVVRSGSETLTEVTTQAAFVALLNVGFDIQLSRSVMLGVRTGYDFMTDFNEALAGRKDHSGFEFGLNFGILFGKAHGPRM